MGRRRTVQSEDWIHWGISVDAKTFPELSAHHRPAREGMPNTALQALILTFKTARRKISKSLRKKQICRLNGEGMKAGWSDSDSNLTGLLVFQTVTQGDHTHI